VPNLNTILNQVQQEQAAGQAHANTAVDRIRRKYLAELHAHTKRNVIAYYSGFLSKNTGGIEINDEDKNGFMTAIHGLDRSKGLDLILHTPGGDIASTQSLVDYLHKMFKKDIRAFVPQIAMSAGTMIACSCKEIWMGKQSNLGPIDPQLNGVPAQGVLTEFKTACKEARDPQKAQMWGHIISKYRPTFLLQCADAIK
jgi:ClpP class serine protease